MDAYRRGDNFFVHLDLPGVNRDSIDVSVEGSTLTISAERRFEQHEGDDVVVRERPQGRFSRQLFPGDSLDAERISANYDQGVLTLNIPVAERAKPRKVEISAGKNEPVAVGASNN